MLPIGVEPATPPRADPNQTGDLSGRGMIANRATLTRAALSLFKSLNFAVVCMQLDTADPEALHSSHCPKPEPWALRSVRLHVVSELLLPGRSVLSNPLQPQANTEEQEGHSVQDTLSRRGREDKHEKLNRNKGSDFTLKTHRVLNYSPGSGAAGAQGCTRSAEAAGRQWGVQRLLEYRKNITFMHIYFLFPPINV